MTESQGLSTLFIRNRHLLWLSIVAILVAGLSSVLNLPRLEDPRIVNRGPLILTPVPGASAERVEALVTDVIEDALQEIEEIKDIESTSRAGISVVGVELKDSVTAASNQEVFAEIRDKIGEVAPLLPPEAEEPVVDDKREAAAFTLITAVRWTGDAPPSLGILNRLAEALADDLRAVRGTEIVRLYGAPEEEITVTVDHAEVAELGVTASGLASRIDGSDAKAPAGVMRGGQSDALMELEGALDSVERVGAVPIAEGNSGLVLRLRDIAAIERSWRTPEEQIALTSGDRAVLVAARMETGRRVDRWAAAAEHVLERARAGLGPGLSIDVVFDQEGYTTGRLRTLTENLLAGAAVIIVTILFLMGWRPAVIVGLALPLVVSLVLFGWQVTGSAIHQMSIFGMIIALGLLIDNAIVVTDEVTTHKARGLGGVEAVGRAVRHLFLPLLASTLTTVLAFAPIMLLPGNAGDFVGAIGTSVIMAISASFFVAMTIIASLAGLFAKPASAGGSSLRRLLSGGFSSPRLARWYRTGLTRLIGVPIAAIAIALTLPLAGFVSARSLGSQFFPPVDRNMFEVKVWLPTEASIDLTSQLAHAIDASIGNDQRVERVDWLVGASFPTVYYNLVMNQDNSPHFAHGIVTTTSSRATKEIMDGLQQRLDSEFAGAQIVVRQFAQGPPVIADIEYRIFGPDIATLQDIGDQVRVALQAHPDVLHTRASMPRGEPKIWLRVDEEEARVAGLSLLDIADQLQANLEGATGGSVLEDLEQLPVRVRYTDDRRRSLEGIRSTPLVRAGGDRWTTLAALGEIDLRPELGGITRFNDRRTNTISAYMRNGALPIDAANEVLAGLEAGGFELPAGYTLDLGGATEQDAEARANLMTYAPILVVVAGSALVLSFRSVRYAAVLALVAPLSVGLALLSTWAIEFPISFNTILGTLGLIGVALNDSIVVLAALRGNPKTAYDLGELVSEVIGCTRHVVATTATTIGGFLPLLLFVGGDFWPSLAIVLAGGIGGASLVALLLIPAAYHLLNGRRLAPARGTTPSPA